MTIRLHNSKTRRKEDFVPLDANNVRMYVCGPTVYDRAHLGNARAVVVFDVLYRLLRQTYPKVTYVRNFTDVDDKINAKAAETGRSIGDITDETIGWYHADMDALGALRPDHEPRATQFIPQMVAMISDLIAKGHAYSVQGHVLFRVRSYAEYGRLSGRSVDDMIAGARVEVSPFKEDPMDFVLWKPSSGEQPGWASPWGFGRPGWHIECSAMAGELLGESFDIHGGGLDLQFPHHENELAQSSCAHPHGGFASVWMHNEMLQVEGKKMSKSLGNFFTVRDLLDQGVPGEVIRFVLLGTHYRKPMDWTEGKKANAEATLTRWAKKFFRVDWNGYTLPDSRVVDALKQDLNTALALTRLREIEDIVDPSVFVSSMALLGFRDWRTTSMVELNLHNESLHDGIDGNLRIIFRSSDVAASDLKTFKVRVTRLYDLIYAAKLAKRYDSADALRRHLVSAGLEVRQDEKITSVRTVSQLKLDELMQPIPAEHDVMPMADKQ